MSIKYCTNLNAYVYFFKLVFVLNRGNEAMLPVYHNKHGHISPFNYFYNLSGTISECCNEIIFMQVN